MLKYPLVKIFSFPNPYCEWTASIGEMDSTRLSTDLYKPTHIDPATGLAHSRDEINVKNLQSQNVDSAMMLL